MAISSFAKQAHSIQFNGFLPITIVVLEEVGYRRYKLKVGTKELTTKSLKPLKKGERFWGDFSYTKDGVLTIGNLKLKPPLLQDEMNFLSFDSWDFIDNIAQNKESFLKEWILDSMDKTSSKKEFTLLNSMLLALHEGIVHLPLKIRNRPFLLQWKEEHNRVLNQSWVDFFFAFDTLGAVKGVMNATSIKLDVLFEKSAKVLENKSFDEKEIRLHVVSNISPLWSGNSALLDLKG